MTTKSGSDVPNVLPGSKSPDARNSRQRPKATQATIVRVLQLAAEGIKQTEIARVVGLSQQTVSDIVARHAPTSGHALAVLQAASYQAASDWIRSFKVAVKKGSHVPMRDCLIATGVVAPDPQSHGVVVVVGTGNAIDARQLADTLNLDTIATIDNAIDIK